MNNHHYLSFNTAMRQRFGKKLYKLSLSAGFTCPNRDGTLGTGGCIFCSGAGEFAAAPQTTLDEQLAAAKARVADKAGDALFAAYFQAFTNTYADPHRLRQVYLPVVQRPDVAVLDIATRPDCLGPEVLAVLRELAAVKPLWVELGLQTIHPQTADFIRRGYDLPVFDRAVKDLHAIGAEVIVHQIIGLPGETEEDIYATAEYIGKCSAEGVKFHLLHVVEGTDLADLYRQGMFDTLEMSEYFRLLAGCIRRIPPDMVVHRLTGDGDKRTLLSPLWSGNKKSVLNEMNRYFDAVDLVQGELWQMNLASPV